MVLESSPPFALMRRRGLLLSIVVIAAGVHLTTGASLTAQPVIHIDSVPSCDFCRIEFGDPIRLQGEFEDGSLRNAGPVLQGANGRIYMFYEGSRSYIDVFAPDGRRTGLQIGREGDGPDEFRSLSHIRVDGDTLRTYDLQRQRRSDFDGRTLELIRTVRLPSNQNALVFEDGRTVLGGGIGTREAAGYPMHVYDSAGDWLRSFGVEVPTLLPGMELSLWRSLAPEEGFRFWAARLNEYRIELWDAEGTLYRTLVGERSWFESWAQYETERSRVRPPQTTLFRLSVDEEGLLWILFIVPADNWADAVSSDVDERGRLRLIPGRPYRTTLLEVVDPDAGELLASHRFEPNRSVSFASPGALAVLWRDELELPRGHLIPFRLVQDR